MNEAHREPEPPAGADLDRPSVARVYDFYLGGTTNWAVDREFGTRVLDKFPLLKDIAMANRMFLNRVVRHLMRRGIRQFLDIGAGVPTVGNTHQVADEYAREAGQEPDAHVVYVDNEPVAVAHAELLLEDEGNAARQAVIEADLRRPDELWQKALATELIDQSQPIALLLIAVLHVHQPGADGNDIGAEAVARLRELLPKGSFLAISHITDEGVPADVGDNLVELKRMYDSSSSSNVIWRSHDEIEALFDGFRMIEPGCTWITEWHQDDTGPNVKRVTLPSPNHAVVWSGVGEKP